MQGSEKALSLDQELNTLDSVLQDGNMNDDTLQQRAMKIMQSLTEAGTAKGFGKARAVPKRLYSLEDLRLNRIDTTKLLSPSEESVAKVEAQLQVSFLLLLVTISFVDGDISRAGILGFTVLFLLTLDQISFAGGLRALAIDTAGGILNPAYRCASCFLVTSCLLFRAYSFCKSG